MKRALDTAAVAVRFEYMSIWTAFFKTSRVSCSFQSKLFSISKLLLLVFVANYLFFVPENCVLFHISFRCS